MKRSRSFSCFALQISLVWVAHLPAFHANSSPPSQRFIPPIPNAAVTTETTDTTSCSTSIDALSLDNDDNESLLIQARIDYVRDVLHQRYEYVKNGKRAMDFARWIQRELGGNTIVFSMHGLDVDLTPLLATGGASHDNSTTANDHEALNHAIATTRTRHSNGNPFTSNLMNMDLPPPPPDSNIPHNLYATNKSHHHELYTMDYDPPSISQLMFRACRLGIHFFPVISTTWIAICSKSFRTNTWYRWIASCLADGGPAFIKWGQWASTRNDMFPDGLCEALSQLHNSAPAHDWSITQATLEASLGIPPNTLLQVFESVDQKPLASGSIAQIHKAALRPSTTTAFLPAPPNHNNNNNNNHNNKHKNHEVATSDETSVPPRTVAIKVRHPHVAKLIDMDFRIMTTWARILDWIPAFAWLHIRETVEQFSHTMAAQAHLHVEAYHLEIFHYNFQKWPQVRFPRPMYANAAVIIESFEPGQIVTDILDMYDAAAAKAATSEVNGEAVTDTASLPAAQESDVRQGNSPSLSPQPVVENDDTNPVAASPNKVEAAKLKGYQNMPIDMIQFIVSTGLSVYLKMLLVDNVMHADLHPGNIMLDVDFPSHLKQPKEATADPIDNPLLNADGKSEEKSKRTREHPYLSIALVDAGMVARLTPEESSNFIGLLVSVGEGDGNKAAEAALRFSLENNLSDKEREDFKAEMVELFAERCKGYGTHVDVGHVLRGVLGLIRKHRVRIDANYATLAVNCLCVESLARRVCPEYNLLDAAKPLLQKYGKIRFQPDGTPKPTSPAQDLMLKLWMPLMNVKKDMADRAFFRRYGKHLAAMKARSMRSRAQLASS